MRLNSIKLSGFKSFAEPTHFQLPGQLVGVVGPNGCGKSNIMDAVRWVLGESKASELRGESMQDVIFNGSELRKPANRASVELIFNNEDARAGGQWNQFSEIAAKRVLTRDGTSSYYINNQPVRRRDVQDVFLGTGLGPRTYAVIGQGTISRIIESKPEELRLYLEEAAGVSKYKERRRETEHRLEDTREHLTRVDDILRELNANLTKLEAQAEVAARYRSLQELGTLKQHQLWFLKHRDAASDQARVARQMQEATNTLEAQLAELRHAEAQMESVRQAHYAASDDLHAAQGALAEAALEVSRLEERIRYVVEGRKRVEQRLLELQAQNTQWRQRQEQAQHDLGRVDEQIAHVKQQAERLPGSQDAVRLAQDRSNEQRLLVAAVQQQIQVLAAESRNTGELLRQLTLRQERLVAEEKALAAPDQARLSALQSQHDAAAQAQLQAEALLERLSEEVPAIDADRRAQQEQLNLAAARQADVGARLEALRTLQDKVKTQEKLKPWLLKHGLDGLQGLWTRIHVEPGWETALEAALRERINALAVGQIETVRAFVEDAPPARLV
ncbi:MAG: AAA family ATPase, partial [Burkholderiaceae bacterium]|nr:AAA family ATPase [Burkholderiaceae bacterium]